MIGARAVVDSLVQMNNENCKTYCAWVEWSCSFTRFCVHPTKEKG